jgi:hypothetical protein
MTKLHDQIYDEQKSKLFHRLKTMFKRQRPNSTGTMLHFSKRISRRISRRRSQRVSRRKFFRENDVKIQNKNKTKQFYLLIRLRIANVISMQSTS